jgi:outer membrane murein-binding lipoprotein Lpp
VRSDGKAEVELSYPPRSSPEYVRKEVTLEKRLFDAFDEGPFVCAAPNIVLVPPVGTGHFTHNVRAAAEKLLSGAASQQQTIDDQAKQIADLKAKVFELETDADPLNDKHTRWGYKQARLKPTSKTREAFKKYHEQMVGYIDLAPSSQKKLVQMVVHPRMEEIYVLCGSTREGFTLALAHWLSQHVHQFHWHGAKGCKLADRYVNSYMRLLQAVPEVWEHVEKVTLAKATAQITTIEFIDLLDECNMTVRGADAWRKKLKLPDRLETRVEKNKMREEQEALLGKWQRTENIREGKSGKMVVFESFWLDLVRVLTDAILSICLMESMQPKLAPKKLIEEGEEKVKQLQTELDALATDGDKTPLLKRKAKIEADMKQAIRNGSYSRQALDDIQEAATGTLLHNQVREGWPVLRAHGKIAYDHAQVLTSASITKSSQTADTSSKL